MSCKDCRGGGGLKATYVNDVRKLYNPWFFHSGLGTSGGSSSCNKKNTMSSSMGKCTTINNNPPQGASGGGDQQKGYYSKKCHASLLRRYETQPWFQNRVVQAEWKSFVDQLVTPKNIGSHLCPGPDDWELKSHKARALIGPTVPCVWDLPVQDKCDSTQYGKNRDWRAYNEDQRMAASQIKCNNQCGDGPVCAEDPKDKKKKIEKGLPYLGKKYGSRYMAWGNQSSSSMPYPHRPVYNYQSRPQCS